MSFTYGNYDCGQIGNFDNYQEFYFDGSTEVYLYEDCLGTTPTHVFEGPRTLDINHDHAGSDMSNINEWQAMQIRRLSGSRHYPLNGFVIHGEYYGFKDGVHKCPYFPPKYHNVTVEIPSDLEIVFQKYCSPRDSYEAEVVIVEELEEDSLKIFPAGTTFQIWELLNTEYMIRKSGMTFAYDYDKNGQEDFLRIQMLAEEEAEECGCTEILSNGRCHECPAGLVAERGRCVYPGTCQAHEVAGTAENCYRCQACGAGTAPDFTKTMCVAAPTQAATSQASCTGDREIYNWDRTACIECNPYARAQRGNTVCLPDACGASDIVTELGTCQECGAGMIPDASRRSCDYPGPLRLNALTGLEGEPTEEQVTTEANEIKAAKKGSFPTVLVAGAAILVLVLTAAVGLMCCRGRSKTPEATNVEQELPAAAAEAPEPSSISKMMYESSDSKKDEMGSAAQSDAARASAVAPAEELARHQAARGSSESGSPKSSTEDSK